MQPHYYAKSLNPYNLTIFTMIITPFNIFTLIIFIHQCAILYIAYRHYLYIDTKRKNLSTKKSSIRTAIIAPYKGIEHTFEQNAASLFYQTDVDYDIYFVVECETDEAYNPLQNIIQTYTAKTNVNAHLLIAGITDIASQKVHNLRHVIKQLPPDIAAFAFVDADVTLPTIWLSALIEPLSRKKIGVTTGYRLYVPTDNRLSTSVLSCINAFTASTMGPHKWNCPWGGSMAIMRNCYEAADIDTYWQTACSDDYSMGRGIKQLGLRVYFVPQCLVPSYDQMSWSQLFEFSTRQFTVTRFYMPDIWLLAFFNALLYCGVFFFGIIYSIISFINHQPDAWMTILLPSIIYLNSMLKGYFRQRTIIQILPQARKALRLCKILDVFFQPFVTAMTCFSLIHSAFKKTIVWRGKTYHLQRKSRQMQK